MKIDYGMIQNKIVALTEVLYSIGSQSLTPK